MYLSDEESCRQEDDITRGLMYLSGEKVGHRDAM